MGIALSSTEAKYVSLSQSLRDFIPIMGITKEMKTFGFEVSSEELIVYYKAFQDNTVAIDLAPLPKIQMRAKPINVVIHNFREYIRKGLINIQKVFTDYQCNETWTKPFPQNAFLKHRKNIFGF